MAVSKSLINLFKQAIQSAIASKPNVRARMRARAAKQRLPVAQWVEDLGRMQDDSIKISQQQLFKATLRQSRSGIETPASGIATPRTLRFWGGGPWAGASTNATVSAAQSGRSMKAPSPTRSARETGALSLGTRHGPEHIPKREGHAVMLGS